MALRKALTATVLAAWMSSSAAKISVYHSGKLCSQGECQSGSTIGAEIVGVTNFTSLTNDDIAVIRQALNDYKVIHFKGVAHLLTPETQLAFAEKFGSVKPEISKVPDYVEKGVHQSKHSVRHTDKHQREGLDANVSINTMVEANKPDNHKWLGKAMPGRVARLVREPGDPFAFGEGYHADVTFFPEPPFFTLLLARELPGGEDDTYFIDTQKAYETLDDELKYEVEGLNAMHNDSAGKAHIHPVVRTHPESKKNVLYVNSHFTHELVGYEKEEGKALLEKVFDHIESQPVYKFKWTCDVENCEGGTKCQSCLNMLMWDNRQLQHTATSDWAHNPVLNKRRRELHRVTISGDQAPYYRRVTQKKHSSNKAEGTCESNQLGTSACQ